MKGKLISKLKVQFGVTEKIFNKDKFIVQRLSCDANMFYIYEKNQTKEKILGDNENEQ